MGAGRAVIWRNLLPSGFVDTRTLHAGLPPKRGSKYAINVWTRTGPFLPTGEGAVPQMPLLASVDKPVQRQGPAVGSALPLMPGYNPVLKVPVESSLTPRVPGPGASPALPSHTPALTGLSATLLSAPSPTSPVESAPPVPHPTLQTGALSIPRPPVAPSAHPGSRVDVGQTALHPPKPVHSPPDEGPENRRAEGMRLSPVSMRTGPSSPMRHMAPRVPPHVSCT